MLCQICLYKESFIIFDDTKYPKPTFITSYQYNYIINPNCYNKIDTCYECLIEKIYECNTELKYYVLKELIYKISIIKIQKWWLNIIYNINTMIGKKYIYKHLSKFTKMYMSIKNI